MAKGQQAGSSESVYLRDENKKMKDIVGDLRSRIAELQARVSCSMLILRNTR